MEFGLVNKDVENSKVQNEVCPSTLLWNEEVGIERTLILCMEMGLFHGTLQEKSINFLLEAALMGGTSGGTCRAEASGVEMPGILWSIHSG